jgi:hypothetical protein
MFLGSRERPVRRADSITAMCEPDCLDSVGSETYRPLRPVTGIAVLTLALLLLLFTAIISLKCTKKLSL